MPKSKKDPQLNTSTSRYPAYQSIVTLHLKGMTIMATHTLLRIAASALLAVGMLTATTPVAAQTPPSWAQDPGEGPRNPGSPAGPVELDPVFGQHTNPPILIDTPIQKVYTHWSGGNNTYPGGPGDDLDLHALCGRNETFDMQANPPGSKAYEDRFVNADTWGLMKVDKPRGQGREVYRVAPAIGAATTQCEFWPTAESRGRSAPGVGQAMPRRVPMQEMDASFVRNSLPPGMYVMHQDGEPVKAYQVMQAPQAVLRLKDNTGKMTASPLNTKFGIAESRETMRLYVDTVMGIEGTNNTGPNHPRLDAEGAILQVGTKPSAFPQAPVTWRDQKLNSGEATVAVQDILDENMNLYDDERLTPYVRIDLTTGLDESALTFMQKHGGLSDERRYATYEVVYTRDSFGSKVNKAMGNNVPAVALAPVGQQVYWQIGEDGVFTHGVQPVIEGDHALMANTSGSLLLNNGANAVDGDPTITRYLMRAKSKHVRPSSVAFMDSAQVLPMLYQSGEFITREEFYSPQRGFNFRFFAPSYNVKNKDETLYAVTVYEFPSGKAAWNTSLVRLWGSSHEYPIHVPVAMRLGRVCDLKGTCADAQNQRLTELNEKGFPRFHNPLIPDEPFSEGYWDGTNHLHKNPSFPLRFDGNVTVDKRENNFGIPLTAEGYETTGTTIDRPHLEELNYYWDGRGSALSLWQKALPYHAYVPYTFTDESTGRKNTTTVLMRGRKLIHPENKLYFEKGKLEVKPAYRFFEKYLTGELNTPSGTLPNGTPDAYTIEGVPPGLQLTFTEGMREVMLGGVPTKGGTYTITFRPTSPDVAPIDPLTVHVAGEENTPKPEPTPQRPKRTDPEPEWEDLLTIRY